jgi:hypothetical protein
MTDDDRSRPDPEAPWDVDRDSHARAQRLRMAELPMTDKLRWLEEAHELALTVLGEEGFRLARERRVGPLPG